MKRRQRMQGVWPWGQHGNRGGRGRAPVASWLLLLCGLGLASACQDRVGDAAGPLLLPEQVTLLDLDGAEVHPLRGKEARSIVFLFTRTDCPISNRYAPEVQGLIERFEPQGIEFFLVYPNASQTPEAIEEHLDSFGYPCRALRDPYHELAALAGATVTPEVALFGRDAELLYRGRIDDRFTDFGKARVQASSRDLENALNAVLAGEPVPVARTEAIGCFLSDLPAETRGPADL